MILVFWSRCKVRNLVLAKEASVACVNNLGATFLAFRGCESVNCKDIYRKIILFFWEKSAGQFVVEKFNFLMLLGFSQEIC